MFFNPRMTPASRQAAQQQVGAYQNAPMPRNIGEGLTSLGSGLEYRQLRRNLADAPDANGFPMAPTQPSAVQRVASALFSQGNPIAAQPTVAPAWGRNDGQQPAVAPQSPIDPTSGIDLSKVFGWGS